jgi:hypothetical protein
MMPPDLEIAIRDATSSKGVRRDQVTDADRASEAAVLRVLRSACAREAALTSGKAYTVNKRLNES